MSHTHTLTRTRTHTDTHASNYTERVARTLSNITPSPKFRLWSRYPPSPLPPPNSAAVYFACVCVRQRELAYVCV